MNAAQLFDHYERVADAPDAIVLLRRFILDLAVRGKLVSQDARDEPASKVLNRIASERAGLVLAGIIKKTELDSLEPEDIPFPVPHNWVWTRLGWIGDWGSGSTPPRDNLEFYGGGITWLKSGELNDNRQLSGSEETVTEGALENGSFRRNRSGDVLFAMYGATIGKLAILAEDAVTNQAVCACTPFAGVLNRFLFLFLLSRREHFRSVSEGGAQPNLSKVKIVRTPFPLPPISEQDRIVAKVDELMVLCDRLEAARAEREATRDRLTAASLARLNVPSADTFQHDTRTALDALTALTLRPDQIKLLRQTILNLAVRGELVPQDTNDEPASEFLNRIAEERADLIRKRIIRREEALDAVERAETPFVIPIQWSWSRVGDAVLFTQYGTSQKSHAAETGVPVLTMGNIQEGLVIWQDEKKIPNDSEDLPSLFLKKFDILYNRTNSAELVGKTGIYLGDDGIRTFASYLIRLRPSMSSSDPRYLNLAMNTPQFRETQIVPLIKKQTGQANVNGTALKNMLIPIPPLPEQRRIVAKVDELMVICDNLEKQIAISETVSRRFLEAVLHEALTTTAEVTAAARDVNVS